MRKTSKIVISILLSIILLLSIICMFLFIPLKGKPHYEIWSYTQDFDIDTIAVVEKQKDKDFKILQLTDIQLWHLAWDNTKALKLVKKAIDDVQPDLIVLTGDNVSGLGTNLYINDLIKVMESYNIPWAPIFGNHDDEGKGTLNWQGDKFLESQNCLFKKGPSNLQGSGNYVINIAEDNKIIQSLFFFDSGRYMKYEKDGQKQEGYINYAQMAWYQWNILGMEKTLGYKVPSMTFSHIAIPEFKDAIKTLAIEKDGRYVVPEELGFGSCSYLPSTPKENSGFFDLAKELGSTHAMFFGHDHENDASITYNGIRLTYGLKAGKSPVFWNSAKEYGGTVITLKNSNDIVVQHKVYENAK